MKLLKFNFFLNYCDIIYTFIKFVVKFPYHIYLLVNYHKPIIVYTLLI